MACISVIIACLNGERTLATALQSIGGQEFGGAVEVLLADNGSTDRTREIFETFARSNRRFATRVIDASARRGKAFALNTAITQATGDRLLFLDDDDEWAPGYLSAMAAALATHPFVASRFDSAALNPPDLYPLRAHEEKGSSTTPFPPHCRLAGGCTQGFRREVFDRTGPYREGLAALEDIDFCIRAAIAGYRLVRVDDAIYRYRYRTDAASVYRQFRGYAAAWVWIQGHYSGESRAFAPQAWATLAKRYVALWLWRAARFHRQLSRFEEHSFMMRLGQLDGAREGAIKTGFPPNGDTIRGFVDRQIGRLRRVFVPSH